MPAATHKDDLLKVTKLEFAKLIAVIEGVTDAIALKKDTDTSIKDVIAHRAHWIELFLGWYRDGQAGRPVYIPAKGYKWNQLTDYNARLRATQKDLTWEDACLALERAHESLLLQLSSMTNEALYGGPMAGANSKWSAGRFAEAAGPSHYRSAAKYIKSRLRALS